jgi:hypothetical protein
LVGLEGAREKKIGSEEQSDDQVKQDTLGWGWVMVSPVSKELAWGSIVASVEAAWPASFNR